MSSTLEEALGPVAPYVPEELVSADGLADIVAVARELPGGLTSLFGFECRLGRPERRADFLLRTREDGGEREHLAGTAPDGGLSDHLLQHPVWARVRDYALHWGAPGSPLHLGSDRVCLEFDLDRSSSAIPLPSLFLGQRPDPAGWPRRGTPSVAGRRANWWMIDTALPLLWGTHLPGAVVCQLNRCLDSLPAGAMLFSAGVMLARRSDDVRLCIAGLGSRGILEYLDRIGWRGPLRDVVDLRARWSGLVDQIGLHIDVGEVVGPRIGLEYHLRPTPSQTPSWQPFLDELVRDGLCRPEKRDGLLAYPGVSDELRDRARWPGRLLYASSVLGSHWVSFNRRSLEYIKIGYEPEKPPEAKAYLGAMYDWFGPAVRAAYSQSSTEGSRPGSASRSSSYPIPAVP